MIKVKVLIPFTDRITDKHYVADDIIEVSNERLAEILAVNVNMVLVLGEAEDKPKPKAKKQTKTTK